MTRILRFTLVALTLAAAVAAGKREREPFQLRDRPGTVRESREILRIGNQISASIRRLISFRAWFGPRIQTEDYRDTLKALNNLISTAKLGAKWVKWGAREIITDIRQKISDVDESINWVLVTSDKSVADMDGAACRAKKSLDKLVKKNDRYVNRLRNALIQVTELVTLSDSLKDSFDKLEYQSGI